MSDLSWLNPTPHAIAVYASRPLSPVATQHSLPSGRYPLLGPDFHRLDRTSLRLAHSFDHLVGEREQHRRDFEAERVAKRRFHSSLPACLSLRARQVPQLAEECFGIFQRSCVETLDEPPINRLQKGIGLQAFALVAPMLGEGGRGAQLPPTGL